MTLGGQTCWVEGEKGKEESDAPERPAVSPDVQTTWMLQGSLLKGPLGAILAAH